MKPNRCICGEKPVIIKEGPIYDSTFRVKCNYCGIECPSKGWNENDAIESWNKFLNRIYENR